LGVDTRRRRRQWRRLDPAPQRRRPGAHRRRWRRRRWLGRRRWHGRQLPGAHPELLEKVAKLPPATDEPEVDVDREGTYDPSFSLRRFTRPFRRPLTIGLLLVVLDTLFALAGPTLIKIGVDSGVKDHSEQALWAVSAVFFVITLLDWADTWAYTRYTGRTAERLLF